MTDGDFELGPLADVTREVDEDTVTLVFTRNLPHPPEKVWRALIEPAEQLEWLPFVANRSLNGLGAAQLRMTDGDEDTGMVLDGEVLASEPARLLSYRWGDDVLTWQLVPHGTGTRLILRHMMMTPELPISSYAAGWHICLDVAERYMEGRPVGRIVGQRAMEFGWAELDHQYQEKLGLAKEASDS